MRPDFERLTAQVNERRSPERLIAHYKVECRLADRLRRASPQERLALYGPLYNELFTSIPDHPQLTRPRESASLRVARQLRNVLPYVGRQSTFVEIGCGDAALATALASTVDTSIGVDVSPALVPNETPSNFHFVLTDGIHLDIPTNAADCVYSNQLMEHLIPDDAAAQLREIRRVLKPGGHYCCVTPSRLTGPHDVSRYFDYVARGFHLREYDYRSIRSALREAGFRKIRIIVAHSRFRVTLPYIAGRFAETFFEYLPRATKTSLARGRIADLLFGINVVAS
jgi:SAM-dependent methyltransferase